MRLNRPPFRRIVTIDWRRPGLIAGIGQVCVDSLSLVRRNQDWELAKSFCGSAQNRIPMNRFHFDCSKIRHLSG